MTTNKDAATERHALIARADKYLHTGSGEYASEIMRDMAEYIRKLPRDNAQPSGIREALQECIDVLALCEFPRRVDPQYGAEVAALGNRIGYGALMSSASASWRQRLQEDGDPVGGEFVAGPCQSTVTRALRMAREALSHVPSGQNKEPKWRHLKRGSIVTEVARGFAQVAHHPIEEMTCVVIYRHDADGRYWVRNAVEFDDGRFEPIESPPQSPGGAADKPAESIDYEMAYKGATMLLDAAGEEIKALTAQVAQARGEVDRLSRQLVLLSVSSTELRQESSGENSQ